MLLVRVMGEGIYTGITMPRGRSGKLEDGVWVIVYMVDMRIMRVTTSLLFQFQCVDAAVMSP
jgi:hypothetical protein